VSQPKVSIVVTTYHEKTRPYLDLCMESIRRLDYPKELLDVVLVSRRGYAPRFEGVHTVWPPPSEFHNPVGLNFGFKQTAADSKFILMLNDDTILTRDCLKNMVTAAGDAEVIMNPISPCDNYWKYQLHFGFKKDGEINILNDRFYRYEQLAPFADELMAAESVYAQGVIHTDMLCLYASLIPRKVWERIGEFDENFKTGQDDYDYCLRARALEIPRVILLNALIWHFGGVTAQSTLNDQIRLDNIAYFEKKWPGEKL
jgi:GT2 family glycosyltransferase